MPGTDTYDAVISLTRMVPPLHGGSHGQYRFGAIVLHVWRRTGPDTCEPIKEKWYEYWGYDADDAREKAMTALRAWVRAQGGQLGDVS